MSTAVIRYLALIPLLCLALPAPAQDTDNDGLPNELEELLATDPTVAETLQTVGTFTRSASPKAAMQFKRVDFGNVGKNRWLWALHFQQPYSFTNAQIIIYLDADNDPATGRQGMGCEYMHSHSEGLGGITAFAPDGSPGTGLAPRVALHEGVLYMCVDCPLKQENGRSLFRYSILSETHEPHEAADNTNWQSVSGPPDSERKVVLTLDQITDNESFAATEGLDLIWKLQADPANLAFRTPDAELKNMKYYFAEYRWWAVTGANGAITVTVPKAGTYYPAVVVYDYGGPDRYQMLLDGKPLGHFVAAEDDRRQRLHFLTSPVTFKGGEKLTLKTGSGGQHITEDLLLLAQKPPIRGRKFELQQVETSFARQDGQNLMRVTWITTWPAACTVEYWGQDKKVLREQEPAPVANHRLYLPGLQPGKQYQFRVIAPRPDGQNVVSKDLKFTFQPYQPFAGKVKQAETPLRVDNPYAFAISGTPISSGVPFAPGELGSPSHARLLGPDGQEVPAQIKPASYWLDGSIKWLLVTFQGGAPASGSATYRLQYGAQVKPMPVTGIKQTTSGTALTINTGPLQVEFDSARSGMPTKIVTDCDGDGKPDQNSLSQRQILATMTNSDSAKFDTRKPERIEIEEAGSLRTIVKVVGHHLDAADKPFLAYLARYEFHAGKPWFRLYYTWGNDGATDFTSFKGLSLTIPAASSKWSTSVDGKVIEGAADLSLRQMEDNECQLPGSASTRRADGWLDVNDGNNGNNGLLVAVRDFWQLYPKAFDVTGDSVRVDLCPEFSAGTYDKRPELDEIKLYYYLQGGQYRVRQGVQKQHELLLYPHAGALTDDLQQQAQLFQQPLIAVCTPERYCGTNVFGEILPATAGRSPEYEQICDNVYRAYTTYREGSRNYGMLNYGDQFGERKVNWANGEYDHHHAFLMQFIRTGDRKWYFLGESAARHAIDVDTCHYGPRLGGEWIHAMGHTGGYFEKQYEGNGIPAGGFSPSHTWTEGMCEWYVLSGDSTASANAALVADYYGGAYLNNYDYSNCRDNGWHLLLTMATYRATNDPYYLNAARIIVERTLERVSPGGGWHRQMVPGHCLDTPVHRGEANFMLGVLANGLEQYYRDIPDPRVVEAIKGGARQAVEELWVPECDGFRYTSCPNMTGYTANNDMTAEVLFFAYRLGGDPKYGEIAMRAMNGAFRDGIGSAAHLRWTPHLIYNMDLLNREGAAFAPQKVVRVVLRNEKAQTLTVRLAGRGPAKWPSLAQLLSPDGKTLTPDEAGLVSLQDAPAGYYILTVTNAPVAWQLHSSSRFRVVDASAGVLLELGKLPSLVHYYDGAGPVFQSNKGAVAAAVTSTKEGIFSQSLTGPGQTLVKLTKKPWLAIGGGELMNPSVPLAAIDGPQTLLPGVLGAEFKAIVTDLDNDVAKYEWEFADGQKAGGAAVKHTFAGVGRQTVRLTVSDRQGNTGTAELSISLPPAELATANPEALVKIEAEDFVDQGLDKVQVFDRLGNSGKMISYWDQTKGHWLEWDVPVKTEGDYVVYLRYTSGAPNPPRRALTIDGASPGAAFDNMTMPLTGGFCTQTDNWAYYAAGGGQPVHFTAGKHRLRLTNLGDGVGLDYIILVPK